MNGISLIVLSIGILLPSGFCNFQPPVQMPSVITNSKPVGDCQACKLFVVSFIKGLERTSRGKFEGGDAAWEEEKLKTSYRRSEIRLLDIQDGICKEEPIHEIQCHHIAEKAEEFIEAWWAVDPDKSEDLYEYLCIDKLKLCCPINHYGKDCVPCKGNLANLCNGNGKCRGDGTRKGNGTCLCDNGYAGENCELCNYGYYSSYDDNMKMHCLPCHQSCLGSCTDGTSEGCSACNEGYAWEIEEGCVDVNECEETNKCGKDKFCVNSEGSFVCLVCDKSCDGCYGDGFDMCRKCAKGYLKKGEFCIEEREDEDLSDKLTTTRESGEL